MTPGEPGGIGLEIACMAWHHLHQQPRFGFALIADGRWLGELQQGLGTNVPVRQISSLDEAGKVFASALPLLHRPLHAAVKSGSFNPANAPWVTSAIAEAVALCLSGQASALVTNPIQKESLYAAGFAHEGHTDFLATLARQQGHDADEVMLLVGGGLRAVPATVHIPLAHVPSSLTVDLIERRLRVMDRDLRRRFGVARPRLAVTGLNPHAGENGTMGREEIDIISPAITRVKADGLHVMGPLPADTAFHEDMRKSYDAILCMYHDQALIPVKALDFHGGVNVTLGLPFIRTSPDHGTALGLAGKGLARPDSLLAAIRLAADMAECGQQ
jgi:4-hydroxythreonine-4-phosphate dehydrogenase